MTKFLQRKFIIFSFILTSLLVTPVIAQTEQSIEDLTKQAEVFQQGYDQAQAGELDKALNTWKVLLNSEPLIPELQRALQNNIAVILMQQKKYDEAKNALNKALSANTQIATTLENRDKLYAYDAQKAYKKIFKNTPVKAPSGELLYFDIKRAQKPNLNVITNIQEADSITIVKKSTENWRKAWSNQDIQAYLSFYDSKAFIPKNSTAFSTWKKSRYRSVLRPKFIKITTADLKAIALADNLVRVEFYQTYQSDRFKDSINKVMLWKKTGEQWKIVQETVIYEK